MGDSDAARVPWKTWGERSPISKIRYVILILLIIHAFVALAGLLCMQLWNWLMPTLFRLPEVSFWQAVGLLVLTQLFFKGANAAQIARSHFKLRKVRKPSGLTQEKPDISPLRT